MSECIKGDEKGETERWRRKGLRDHFKDVMSVKKYIYLK